MQGHTFKTRKVTVSTIFIKTEKVKQNGKTEKYVSKKSIKKKTWKDPNEAEINNLSDEEFKVKVIKNAIELRKRTDEYSENVDTGLENIRESVRTALVVQWLRISLPKQETPVQSLVQEDPTCRRATKPMCHHYGACALQPVLCNKRGHHDEKPAHDN